MGHALFGGPLSRSALDSSADATAFEAPKAAQAEPRGGGTLASAAAADDYEDAF